MTLVSWQFELEQVPCLKQRWCLRSLEVQVVGTHSRKELSLLLAIFPVTELPFVSVDKDSHDAFPPCFGEVRYGVIDIESHLTAAYLALYLGHESTACTLHHVLVILISLNITSPF